MRLPLAAHAFPGIRFSTVVRAGCPAGPPVLLPPSNPRSWAVGQTFPFITFVPNSGSLASRLEGFSPSLTHVFSERTSISAFANVPHQYDGPPRTAEQVAA